MATGRKQFTKEDLALAVKKMEEASMPKLDYSIIYDRMNEIYKEIQKHRQAQIRARLEKLGFCFKSDEELISFAKVRLTIIINDDRPYIKNLYLDHSTNPVLICYWDEEASFISLPNKEICLTKDHYISFPSPSN